MERDKPAWLDRLIAKIAEYKDRTNRSDRYISRAAGLGVNFVSQLAAKNWREPSFSSVVKLCMTVDASITYVVTGAEMSRDMEEALSLYARLPDDQKRTLFAFLRSLAKDAAPLQ